MLVKDEESVPDDPKLINLSCLNINASQQASRYIREELADYLCNEGSLSWQMGKI